MKQFEIDLSKAFAPMPAEFHETIEFAFERGDKAMKKRNKIITLMGIAAVLSIAFAAAALAIGGLNAPRPDNVALVQPVLMATAPEDTVESRYAYSDPATLVPEPEASEFEETADSYAACFYGGDYSEPEALYILLTEAHWAHAQENNLTPDSRAIYTAAEELRNIALNNPGDTNQWLTPIRECLQSMLGFSEDFIARHYIMNEVVNCLQAQVLPEPEEIPEEAAGATPEPTPTPAPRLQPGEIAFAASYPVLVQEETNASSD